MQYPVLSQEGHNIIYITNTRLQWIDKQINKIKKGVNALIYIVTPVLQGHLWDKEKVVL